MTGNTGFKGAWLTHILLSVGAEVIGYALEPPTQPSLFKLADMESNSNLHQIYADIRDLDAVSVCFEKFLPEIVIHMAAQPIVRESYRNPVDTYSTNVMGTVNICEAVRKTASVRSFLNVTTDKVYKNREWEYGYREDDELDGFDPYSNSKSCSELVTHSYRDSFLLNKGVAVSTARAGNVIGGGDFSNDRIIPDCVRAALSDRIIEVRNPYSTRPYQHVLEPLFAYLMIASRQFDDVSYAGYYNVGPDDIDCVATGDLTNLFCEKWNEAVEGVDIFNQVRWADKAEADAPHEANFLKLDCSRIKTTFGWHPRWRIETAIDKVVEWTKCWQIGDDLKAVMDNQIADYIR